MPDGLEILTIQRNQGQLLHGKNDPFSLNPAMKLIEQVTIFFSIILSSLDYGINWEKVNTAGNTAADGWAGAVKRASQAKKAINDHMTENSKSPCPRLKRNMLLGSGSDA